MTGDLKMTCKIPGPEVGYTDLIDLCLENDTTEFNAFPLRPSSAGKCSRALSFEVYEYYGGEKLPKEVKAPNVKRLLSLGSSVEYHVIKHFDMIAKANRDFKITYKQQALSLFRLKPASETDTNPPLIEGSLDLAVMNYKEGWGGFGDVKSAKDKFSHAYGSKWDETLAKLSEMQTTQQLSAESFWVESLDAFLEELKDPFFEDNFLQLNTYCSSQFAKEHNITHGFIFRYNKNDSRHLEVRFKPSDTLYGWVEDKFNRIYSETRNTTFEAIKAKGCEFPLGHIKRAFCPCFIYAGEDQGEALKAYFATFPPKKWPTDAHKLRPEVSVMFKEFEDLQRVQGELSQLEARLTKLLSEEECSKVRLENGHVYEVKCYKTGGFGGGPRTVLKRAKP